MSGPLLREFPLPKLVVQPSGKPLTLKELLRRVIEHSKSITPHEVTPSGRKRYHIFGHFKTHDDRVRFLFRRFQKAGIRFSEEDVYVARLASYIHDLGYYFEHLALGFPSKEEFSAHYGFNLLHTPGFRAPAGIPEKVARATQATNPAYKIETLTEMISRAADLFGLGVHDYRAFSEDWDHLLNEARSVPGKQKLTEKDFAPFAINYLAQFAHPFLRLTGEAFTFRGTSAWHENMIAHLARKWAEIHGGRDKVRFITQIGVAKPITLERRLDSNELFVGIDPNDGMREKALASTMKEQASFGSNSPRLFLPGIGKRLPLNFKLDEIHYVDVNHEKVLDLGEIQKSLAPRGKVVVRETRAANDPKTRGRPTADEVVAKFRDAGFQLLSFQKGQRGRYHLVFTQPARKARRP